MPEGGTILVVDDNPAVRESTAEILRVAGYAVETATNADQAVAALEEGDIDLALLDLGLPDSAGLHVLDRVRVVPPVIAVSGTYLGDADIDPGDIHPRVTSFMRKPVMPQRLLAEVDRLLHGS